MDPLALQTLKKKEKGCMSFIYSNLPFIVMMLIKILLPLPFTERLASQLELVNPFWDF